MVPVKSVRKLKTGRTSSIASRSWEGRGTKGHEMYDGGVRSTEVHDDVRSAVHKYNSAAVCLGIVW